MKLAIKEHDDVEESVTFKYYSDLGVRIPSRHTADHSICMDLTDIISKQLMEMKDLTDAEEDNQQALAAKTAELKTAYTKLSDFMLAHFEDEVRFWPAVIEPYGEVTHSQTLAVYFNLLQTKYHEVQEQIGKYSIDTHKESFQALICASLHCMGIKIKDSPLPAESDNGWAGEQLREAYLKFMDSTAKNVILPAWNKKYLALRVLVDSCSTENSITDVNNRINQVTA